MCGFYFVECCGGWKSALELYEVRVLICVFDGPVIAAAAAVILISYLFLREMLVVVTMTS